MELPKYPEEIETPETLMILTQTMRAHSHSIGANDWAAVLSDIHKALFWAATIKSLVEQKNENPF